MYSKLLKFFKDEKNDMLLSIIVGLVVIFTYSVLNYSYTYSMNIKKDLADNVIRFHVLANSDSVEDQQLKIYVKDMILMKYKEELLENSSREDAIKFFKDNTLEIQSYAKDLVKAKGYDYNVKCELNFVDFPTKTYNDITLPNGQYLAFRVLIGDHAGKNFWCVLYPPLCYVDAVDKDNFDVAKEKLSESLTEDEYVLISETEKPTVKVKFKILEMWN